MAEIKYNVHVATYLVNAIVIMSAIGFAISTYSFLHYSAFTSGAVCNLSDTFSCDVVNRGPFASIGGIPVSVIGMAGYAFLFVTALLRRKHPEEKPLGAIMILATTVGFLFSLYLTFIEAFVLQAYCILCLTSFFIMLLIMIVSFWLHSENERQGFLTAHIHPPQPPRVV